MRNLIGLLAIIAVVRGRSSWSPGRDSTLGSSTPVERVADAYLKALAGEEPETANRFGIVEEPPAIRSVSAFQRDRSHDRTIKGSFAPVGKLHKQIEADFVYDASIGRFTPKNAMGPAAETLDALHKAKEDAEKSGVYKKMQSGDPDELFESAEEFGKVFDKLAKDVLAPKKILPTYQMLVESAKPPLPNDAKALALEAAGSMPIWNALLKRSFLTLKADGPFIYERARVNAMATDRLASLGDPPSRIRLELVRFRLEGIDTGWKVVTARACCREMSSPRQRPGRPRPLNRQPRSRSPCPPAKAGLRPAMHLNHRDASARFFVILFEVEETVPPSGLERRDPQGRLAQLVRAPALHAGCRGFESLIAHFEHVLSAMIIVAFPLTLSGVASCRVEPMALAESTAILSAFRSVCPRLSSVSATDGATKDRP